MEFPWLVDVDTASECDLFRYNTFVFLQEVRYTKVTEISISKWNHYAELVEQHVRRSDNGDVC